ncbi:MAG TPA: hypothetical protein VFR80_13390, partial [Pyrinomonadaceae bacterium]|nr:hypothetical protein [Pyrinomonadaceae bacterium]
RAAGFNMRITNKSSKRVKAQFLVSASVEQNGVTVKDGSRDITEIWEPQEIKEILIPYNHADKPYNDSGARRVYYSANSLETPK